MSAKPGSPRRATRSSGSPPALPDKGEANKEAGAILSVSAGIKRPQFRRFFSWRGRFIRIGLTFGHTTTLTPEKRDAGTNRGQVRQTGRLDHSRPSCAVSRKRNGGTPGGVSCPGGPVRRRGAV